MALTTDIVSPKAAALPPLPAEDPLTAAQWKTLLAIADAIVPAVRPAKDNEYSTAISKLQSLTPDADEAVAKAYLHENATSNPAFREGLHRVIGLYLPQSSRKELGMVRNSGAQNRI
jgi:hypothetical protein